MSWLELFFDLVYVVIIAELAHGLAKHVDGPGLLAFGVLFVPVWWMWIGNTFYTERFETHDVSHRVATFLQMLPAAALAVYAHDGLGDTSREFALAYAAGRLVLAGLWFRGAYHDPVVRPAATPYITGLGVSVALFVASAFVDAPWRFVLWGVALGVDLLTPFLRMDLQRALPRLSTTRLPERFGLFTIIVLGESVIGTVGGVAARDHPGLAPWLTALFGMGLAFGLWWLYFDGVAHRLARPGRFGAIARSYLHLPLVMSVTAVGAGVLNVVGTEGDTVSAPVAWLIGGALAAALASIAALAQVVEHPRARPDVVRALKLAMLAGAAVALAVAAAGPAIGPLPLLAGLNAALLLPIAYAAHRWARGHIA